MADIIQTWFADDSSVAGRLRAVREWWDSLSSLGVAYGYHLNPTKSILLVKPGRYHEALDLFANTGVQERMDGCRHLGAALGTAPFVEEYLADRVSGFLGQVNKLCGFAESQPQAAYHALVNGLQSKWTFLCRTVEGAAEALKPLDEAIHHKLLPMVTGYHPNEMEREMVSFPCRHGGLGIVVPTTLNHQYTTSKTIAAPLVERFCSQAPLGDSLDCIRSTKRKLSAANRRSMKSKVLDFLAAAPAELSYSGQLASQL